MNLHNIDNISINGINYNDAPDFVDAFIYSASWKDTGIDLTEDELDELNQEYGQFVYECVIAHIY